MDDVGLLFMQAVEKEAPKNDWITSTAYKGMVEVRFGIKISQSTMTKAIQALADKKGTNAFTHKKSRKKKGDRVLVHVHLKRGEDRDTEFDPKDLTTAQWNDAFDEAMSFEAKPQDHVNLLYLG